MAIVVPNLHASDVEYNISVSDYIEPVDWYGSLQMLAARMYRWGKITHLACVIQARENMTLNANTDYSIFKTSDDKITPLYNDLASYMSHIGPIGQWALRRDTAELVNIAEVETKTLNDAKYFAIGHRSTYNDALVIPASTLLILNCMFINSYEG